MIIKLDTWTIIIKGSCLKERKNKNLSLSNRIHIISPATLEMKNKRKWINRYILMECESPRKPHDIVLGLVGVRIRRQNLIKKKKNNK